MDFSAWMQSPLDWCVLFFSAIALGMSKTGVQGISMLAVPLMAINFGAKVSTGLILPMLCIADLMAVIYYRRVAEWKYVLKLIPPALLGFLLALAVDQLIAPEQFRRLMGGCLLFVMVVMFFSEWKGQSNQLASRTWYGWFFGLLGGFTTMIGNAAGPVMAIYLLSIRLPKYSFVGTNAWFFLVINYLKIPIQIFAWDNISLTSFVLDLYSIPFLALGAYLGIRLIHYLPEKGFRYFTMVLTAISVVLLLI